MSSLEVTPMFARDRKSARGLIVGKFCPLHLGHELLIRTALDQCEELLLLSYCKPEFPGYTRARRERWLQIRFPQAQRLVIDDEYLQAAATALGLVNIPEIPHNDADEHSQRVFVGWICRHLLNTTVDAVFTSEDYGDGFAAVLTDYLGTESDKPVQHICVDKPRARIPVSGTRLRADIHRERAFLAADIYGDFVERICFLGGESSGKTTLAQTLARALNTQWVPEFGRELWQRQNGVLQYEDMLTIGRTQATREDTLVKQSHRWLFCDTSPLTTLFYSGAMFGQAGPELEALAARHYHTVFLCAPDFPFAQDGTRQDDNFRLRQHQWYQEELARRQVPFHLLEGDPSARLAEVQRVLQVNDSQVPLVVD